jgi:hypothetical protein
MVGPAAKRAAVAHLEAKLGLSERRACSIAGADRKMIRYRSRRPPDTELRARLRELADLSPNFHPPISGVPVTFEPNGLGEAGRGAEPPA